MIYDISGIYSSYIAFTGAYEKKVMLRFCTAYRIKLGEFSIMQNRSSLFSGVEYSITPLSLLHKDGVEINSDLIDVSLPNWKQIF